MLVFYFSCLGTLATNLAAELRSEIFMYRSHLLADSTKRSYTTHKNMYFRFCFIMGYCPVPATTEIICHYTAFLARSLKVSSIKNYLNIISLLHKELGLSNPLSDNWFLKSLLTGIKRIKGNEIKQKLPITLNILRGIFYLLNMNNSYDATFWAVCLVMFFGLFRKSHLLPLSHTKFDSNKQFSRSSFKFYYWGILLTVKWSKTIQFRERSVQIPLPRIPGSIFCPVSSLQHALSFTSGAPAHSHAFSYLDLPHCNRRCMTYRSFVSKLRSCLRSLGVSLDDYAGHSFRRGGASFAFQAGVPIEMIGMLGDWKSNSVLLYLTVPLRIRLQSTNILTKHLMHL